MNFKHDPNRMYVLVKTENDRDIFLGRHFVVVLSVDGWVKRLRKTFDRESQARKWGERVSDKLIARWGAQQEQGA